MASLAQTRGNRGGSTQTWGENLLDPMTFDEEKNLLYVPGGNAAPDIMMKVVGRQSVYDSLIALDPSTGRLVWYRQFIRTTYMTTI